MGLDDYVESRCDECETTLVQLDGNWYCPDCGEGDTFSLVPEREDFAL